VVALPAESKYSASRIVAVDNLVGRNHLKRPMGAVDQRTGAEEEDSENMGACGEEEQKEDDSSWEQPWTL